MATGKTKVKIATGKITKNQILNAVMSSKAFQDQAAKKVAQPAAKKATEHVERHFRAGVEGIANSLVGVPGGGAFRKQQKVVTPEGDVIVKFPPDRAGKTSWRPLTESYRLLKGHDLFWINQGLVRQRFVSSVVAGYTRKKFTSYSTKMIRKSGQSQFDLTLSVELKKLPNPYDALVRRPFLSGAKGGELPQAPAFNGKSRRVRLGLNRILWPENQRPLLRPVAYRMGRLTLQNFRKTLEI